MEPNEQNNTLANRTRGMETRNRLTSTRGEWGGDNGVKEVEGSSQGRGIKDKWTKTAGVGLKVGGQGGYGRGKLWEEMRTTVTEQE